LIARGTKTYGIVLPHFGSHATGELLLRSAKRIEELGFDAVWVRDHLVYEPGGHEDQDITHIEPFVVMAAVAGVTTKLVLATATLIPYRHPIHSALLLGSLREIAGPGRVIAGWGLGGHDVDFASIGIGDWDRKELLSEQIDIMRRLWSGQKTNFTGKFYKFSNVAIKPVPSDAKGIPMWYGGGSKAAARRAVELCDGLITSRMPRRDFKERIARMQRLSAQSGRDRPVAGVIPYVSPGRSVEDGARHFNLPALYAAMSQYDLPPSGMFNKLEDLDGAAMAGPAEIIVEHVQQYHALGCEHFVFDFRSRFAEFEQCVEFAGTEVLPRLRRS
jgi:alkanesulfonate monooxygenase SsuD/methylene tetrahydromethanopterin reductase-like flavin-dependent oxidoreductase (luciferase family)